MFGFSSFGWVGGLVVLLECGVWVDMSREFGLGVPRNVFWGGF